MSRFISRQFLAKVQTAIDTAIDAAREQAKDYARSRVLSARADLQMFAEAKKDEAVAEAAAFTEARALLAEENAATAAELYTDAIAASFMGMDVLIPTTGTTVTAEKRLTILAPAAGLAALTIALPEGVHNQRRRIASTRAITALTYNPASGDVVVSQAPSTLAAGGFFELCFVNGATKTWVRIG